MNTRLDVGTLGERIQQARKAAGYTLDALAAQLGTTRQVLIGWEQDKHRPVQRHRVRLAEVLARPELLSDDEEDE
jgi:transcriptional regulator with XRE-family HTH domain